MPDSFDWQGHRGCRGLLPENSLPGFAKALELGVRTLEMDLVISADSQVIVSHEPWLSHEICADLDGVRIPADSQQTYNMFRMSYAEIQQHDCGSLPHARFPQQASIPVSKPLLASVIDSAEAQAKRLGRPLPWYNLEIKRRPEWDGLFHPAVENFVNLVLAEVAQKGIQDRCVIQSFDPEALQVTRAKAPSLPLAMLIENERSLHENLEQLGFVPAIYSPYFQLVDADLIQTAHTQGMQVIPWTVNEVSDMKRLRELGVDGLITDYPDRALSPDAGAL